MTLPNLVTLLRIAREKNYDGVQRRTGETANTLVGTVAAFIAEHFRTRRHALLEFFGKCSERLLIQSKGAQSLPRERNGDPSLLAFDRFSDLLSRSNLVQNPRQPGSSLGGLTKREKLVSTRNRGDTRQEKILDVVALKYRSRRTWSDLCSFPCLSRGKLRNARSSSHAGWKQGDRLSSCDRHRFRPHAR